MRIALEINNAYVPHVVNYNLENIISPITKMFHRIPGLLKWHFAPN